MTFDVGYIYPCVLVTAKFTKHTGTGAAKKVCFMSNVSPSIINQFDIFGLMDEYILGTLFSAN